MITTLLLMAVLSSQGIHIPGWLWFVGGIQFVTKLYRTLQETK